MVHDSMNTLRDSKRSNPVAGIKEEPTSNPVASIKEEPTYEPLNMKKELKAGIKLEKRDGSFKAGIKEEPISNPVASIKEEPTYDNLDMKKDKSNQKSAHKTYQDRCRKFICPCGKQFYRAYHLRVHKNLHLMQEVDQYFWRADL